MRSLTTTTAWCDAGQRRRAARRPSPRPRSAAVSTSHSSGPSQSTSVSPRSRSHRAGQLRAEHARAARHAIAVAAAQHELAAKRQGRRGVTGSVPATDAQRTTPASGLVRAGSAIEPRALWIEEHRRRPWPRSPGPASARARSGRASPCPPRTSAMAIERPSVGAEIARGDVADHRHRRSRRLGRWRRSAHPPPAPRPGPGSAGRRAACARRAHAGLPQAALAEEVRLRLG